MEELKALPWVEKPRDEEERIGTAPIYPNTSINGISNGYITTTNAIKVNGCTVGTLVDTGACFTFFRY